MDSGNSSSMQSSSGGEEEYDSRAESISSFLNPTAGGHVGHMSNPPPPSQPPAPQHLHHLFDPLSNYFDPVSSTSSTISRSSLPLTSSTINQNSLLNLDMVWSKGLRSEPDLGGFFISSSASASSSTQQLFTNHGALQSRTTAAAASTFPAALHIPQGTAERAATRASVSGLNIDQTSIMNNSGNSGNSFNMGVRNPKKRSRASRRAPTTVLTTDTTNFRAMVQEFTGIPAPFTSSPFPRTRLDLFGTSSSSLRSTASYLDSSQPSYLLRPFAHKIGQIPFVSPSTSASSSSSFSCSSMIDAIASTTTANITSASAAAASNNNNNHNNSNSTSINMQNLLNINMQNPILNLQSFLQAPQKYPQNSPILETKPQGSFDIVPSNDSYLKIGVLDELGLSHAAGHGHHLNTNLGGGLQSIVSSEATTFPIRSSDHHQSSPTTWPSSDGTGPNENDQRLFGDYNSSRRVNANGKVVNNFMASPSSSDFHHNHRDIKGQENVAAATTTTTTRSEGMVESWICSSD